MDQIETLVAVERQNAYTEAYLFEDGSIGLDVEDEEVSSTPRYTLEEAKRLHAALGHLIWLAESA